MLKAAIGDTILGLHAILGSDRILLVGVSFY